jgi:hypothetical protein
MITTSQGYDLYNADGTTKTFSITFDVRTDANGDARDIGVWLIDSSGSVTKLSGSDYTVSGTDVITNTAYASGYQVFIAHDGDFLQSKDYVAGGQFEAASIEDALDKLQVQQIQLKELLDRAPKIRPQDDRSVSLLMPDKAARKSNYFGFNADGEPISVSSGVSETTVSPYMETVLDDADAGEALVTLQARKASIEDSKEMGELFFVDEYIPPKEFDSTAAADLDKSKSEVYWPVVCLSAIDHHSDIDDANYPLLGPRLRARRLHYQGGTGSDQYQFTVTGWDISSNVATLSFDTTTPEKATLEALLEDQKVNGSYTDFRTITLPNPIGDIAAGTYAITTIDTGNWEIEFAYTAGDNSGTGTYVAEFAPHKLDDSLSGAGTKARLFEVSGRSIVSANDASDEVVSGLRRRDRMQGHWHDFHIAARDYDANVVSGSEFDRVSLSAVSFVATNNNRVRFPQSDGQNGTPRTGSTTDPRSVGAHVYMWAKRYKA